MAVGNCTGTDSLAERDEQAERHVADKLPSTVLRVTAGVLSSMKNVLGR